MLFADDSLNQTTNQSKRIYDLHLRIYAFIAPSTDR